MSVPTKKISDLFSDVKIGGTPSRGNPSYFDGSNLWVSIRDMEGQPILTRTAECISDDGVRNSNCKLVKKGSLLFSFKLTVGRTSFAGEDLYTNEAIAAFDPDEAKASGIDLDYLSLVLPMAASSDNTKNSMGAALLNKNKILNLDVPYLELTQQRKIAASLKAQLTEVETARQAALVQLSDVRLLRQRLISETFERINAAPTILSEVIIGIQAGKSFQTSEILAQPNELGVLKVSAISWSNFQPEQAKSVNNCYKPDDKHRVSKDDFIISRANTKELVGAVVLVDQDYPLRLLSDKTLRLLIDEEKADKEYLLYALRAPLARAHIEHFATGTSDSMRNISQKVIASIPLVLPSKPEQKNIVQKLKSKLVEIDAIEQVSNAILTDIEKLPALILTQTFEN
ncbi:TPA: restriction endonuclease subunit S [Vibrio parahaemolyticus]|nr:restriction endonuclease subunit S [Vibrio parahaemolyticus]ELP2674756.1 restriction endonuclease subunit S [Vibrio parahaemolyticus]HCE2912471.1 restriction endonuclease subunit S [Vibrio parahaemolyticus]HCG5094247.1 restriction endonuclease subunit S [Vibrio parahaemolyticus]